MKLIAKVAFKWAHGGSDVRQYEPGQRIETDDADLVKVATAEGWAEESDWPPDEGPEREPTEEELLAAHAALIRRQKELDDLAERLSGDRKANEAEAVRLQQLAADQAAEAKRLGDEAAQLASDKAAFEAAKAAAPAPAAGKTKSASAG